MNKLVKLIKNSKLPKEKESGNIEYKRKLYDISKSRFDELVSQLKWRLTEGYFKDKIYSAIYIIGVEDDGNISGLTKNEISKSVDTITKMIKKCSSKIDKVKIVEHKKSYIAVIKIIGFKKNKFKEIKICFLGSSFSGKTTLISVLSNNQLDNGEGKARLKNLKHLHEYYDGKTSSINYEIIGINKSEIINYKNNISSSWEQISSLSSKVITLIDLPGDLKFIKTIIFGLLSNKPNYVGIVIDSFTLIKNNYNICNETLMYINFCVELDIKYFIILNKIDLVKDFNKKKILNIFKKINLNVEYFKNRITYKNNYIIPVSFVSGTNIDLLKKFILNINVKKNKKIKNKNVEFIVNEIFFVPDIGIVLSGILLKGTIKINDRLIIGPVKNKLINIEIITIHRKQVSCNILNENQSGSFLIKILSKDISFQQINKRTMIVNKELINNFTNSFLINIDKKYNHEWKNKYLIYFNNLKCIVDVLENNQKDDYFEIKVKTENSGIIYLVDKTKIVIKLENKYIFGFSKKI